MLCALSPQFATFVVVAHAPYFLVREATPEVVSVFLDRVVSTDAIARGGELPGQLIRPSPGPGLANQ